MTRTTLLLVSGIFAFGGAGAQTCSTANIVATTPSSVFTLHTDGTLTDERTGLMWKRCGEGQAWDAGSSSCAGNAVSMTWQYALDRAVIHDFAGYSDWRLPNIKELRSIVERQCSTPSINAVLFPGTAITPYWSATPDAAALGKAWYVHFEYGYDGTTLNNATQKVRYVRDLN